LARLCKYERIHAAEVHLYAGAIAADPKLATNSRQSHRYNPRAAPH
jgi:hypothetical protein